MTHNLKDNLSNFVKTPPYLNLFINAPFYHEDYLSSILDAVLCSTEKQMNTHNHSILGLVHVKVSLIYELVLTQVSSLNLDN